MPTYTYKCEMGHETDEMRSVADRDSLWVCHFSSDGILLCGSKTTRVEFPSATPYITRPGVGNRSSFSRDRAGK